MFENLRMLLKLRAWLRSGQLMAGGVVGLLGLAQTWLASADGMGLLESLAVFIGLMPATVSGLFTAFIGLVLLLFRAKTEWSLKEKVEGKDLE